MLFAAFSNKYTNFHCSIKIYQSKKNLLFTEASTEDCLSSMDSGCESAACCDGLQCFNGTDGSWTRGVCVDDELFLTLLELSSDVEQEGMLSFVYVSMPHSVIYNQFSS